MGPKRDGFSVWLCTIDSYGPYLHFELWQGARLIVAKEALLERAL